MGRETEQNIAAAFREASEDGLLLVFDEADSFLHSRARARLSWEVSTVNEMLTAMEHHPLPFICTTNLMEQFDEAAFRRFTFKIRLDFLGPQPMLKNGHAPVTQQLILNIIVRQIKKY